VPALTVPRGEEGKPFPAPNPDAEPEEGRRRLGVSGKPGASWAYGRESDMLFRDNKTGYFQGKARRGTCACSETNNTSGSNPALWILAHDGEPALWPHHATQHDATAQGKMKDGMPRDSRSGRHR
jgi:hypothetical protein